jgi:hypothetical protein
MTIKINELENQGKTDHPLLYNYRVKRETFKNRKLTKHFVEVLLRKMEIPEETVARCTKVPLKVYAKILDITHLIVNGKAGYGKLGDLRELMCDDLKVIPERLKDLKIFNDVRNYLNRHVKALTR